MMRSKAALTAGRMSSSSESSASTIGSPLRSPYSSETTRWRMTTGISAHGCARPRSIATASAPAGVFGSSRTTRAVRVLTTPWTGPVRAIGTSTASRSASEGRPDASIPSSRSSRSANSTVHSKYWRANEKNTSSTRSRSRACPSCSIAWARASGPRGAPLIRRGGRLELAGCAAADMREGRAGCVSRGTWISPAGSAAGRCEPSRTIGTTRTTAGGTTDSPAPRSGGNELRRGRSASFAIGAGGIDEACAAGGPDAGASGCTSHSAPGSSDSSRCTSSRIRLPNSIA